MCYGPCQKFDAVESMATFHDLCQRELVAIAGVVERCAIRLIDDGCPKKEAWEMARKRQGDYPDRVEFYKWMSDPAAHATSCKLHRWSEGGLDPMHAECCFGKWERFW